MDEEKLLNRIITLYSSNNKKKKNVSSLPSLSPSSPSASHNVAACRSDAIYHCDKAHIHRNCPFSGSRRIHRNVFASSAFAVWIRRRFAIRKFISLSLLHTHIFLHTKIFNPYNLRDLLASRSSSTYDRHFQPSKRPAI